MGGNAHSFSYACTIIDCHHVCARTQVGCGLPASHPVVRLLLQQLQDSMALPSATDSSSQPEKSLKSGEDTAYSFCLSESVCLNLSESWLQAIAVCVSTRVQVDACEYTHVHTHAHLYTHTGERQLGGNDASRVVEGAEGGFSWVQKRAGYEVKRQHLRQVRGQREEGPSRCGLCVVF